MKYFLFDKAQKYVTRINTEYLIEAHYTEEINAAGQLEFTLPATMRLPKNVFYVCVTDPDDERSYLMFKIVTEKVTDEKVTYTCIENAYDELASYTYIKDKRPTAIASAMLQMVLDGTRWSVGACPEVSPKFCSFYYISVLEAIQKIVNLWGFEVQFQVKIDGITNEIKQRNISLYTKLGKRTNKRFEYGSNLLSVTQANDSTGLYTALVGRGKGVQVSNGDTDTDPDGYGRRITFADVVWSTQSGNPLNKPAGQEYLEDPNATAAYGFPDGHPRIGFVTFQDCEDPNELIQLTYDKLQEVNHPQVQFSASIADVGSLDLGDTIAIVRHDIGIEYYTRVFKVVHDLLDSSNNTVELGDNIAGSNSITQQISNIQNNQSNVQNAIDTIVMSGSDGNKLFFGTDFPANGTDGDIFYKTLENGGTEMYIYKDGGWQLVVSTEELNAVQKKVDEQTSQIQQAVDDANSAVSKADEAVAKVGDAETTAKNAQATAQQNQADLAQAKNDLQNTKSQLTNVQSDLAGTKSSLAGAISNISQAQEDLKNTEQGLQGVKSDLENDEKNLSDLTKQAQAQRQTIVDIQKTQSGLTADIADVKGNVSSLQDTANSLQATVKDNQGNISKLQDTASGLQATVKDNQGNISKLQGTANSLQSSITNNANNISNIKQTADGIQSTVSNMKVSSENLLPDTLDFAGWQQGGQGNMDSAQADNTLTNAWHAWGDNNSAWIGSPQAKPVFLRAGTQYTFSAVCWNYGSSTGNNFDSDDVELYFNNNDNSKAYNHQLTGKTNKDHIRYSVTFTVDTDGLYWGFKIVDMSGFIGGSLWSAEYMLVEGNVAVAYQPSSTAMATDISTVQQTVNGLKSTVQNNKGDISQLKQTSDSLTSQIGNANNDISSLKQRADSMESNISDNKNDISDLRQTANSLQSNIQSKADISQITQLSNAIQSVVQSVGSFFPNGDFADSNIQAYWSPWDVTKDYTNINFDAATYNGSFGNLLLHASGGGWTKAISTEYIPVQPNKSVTVSLASRGDWYDSNGKPQLLQCYVHFYDSKKNATENGHFDLNCSNNQQWYDNSVTYDCNSNECYIRVEICLQGNQENWAHITNVKVSSDGGESISSKISQMADDINLRVQKGDLLSQINIQAGKTLIQSNKLYLDASSVVFSGSAFIPSAAITDLSADKITTGTLNAANVHVINMDVANLVGDKTSFVRSQWQNAYGAYVNIDGSGMSVGYGNWFTKFDGLGMNFTDGGGDLGGFTRIGMDHAPSWYGGLAFNAGGDAEFLSIGAKDYHNDNQNPIPSKLLWARRGIDTYGYNPGWNFGDDVWTDKIGINSIQYGSWNIRFGIVVGSNGFSALTLTSGIGNGFYWGSDGSFGYVTGGNALHNVKGSQIVYSIGSDGICHSWGGV